MEPFAAYVDYTADLEIFKTEKPYELYQVEGLPQSDLTNVVYEPHNIACQLEDIRGRESNFSLHEHSFCYMKHTSQVPVVEEDDMMHPYATEVNGLLKQMFNTPHVICYDVRRRMNRPYSQEESMSSSRSVPSPPVTLVHTDHTPSGGWGRIKRHLSDAEFRKFASGEWRARIINVWRPITSPVVDSPLGLCDFRTVDNDDLLASDHVSVISTVEVFQLKHNKNHHWYYLKNQTSNEICIFLAFDSHPPEKIQNYVPHAAITLPFCPPTTVPRESIETRSIVFTPVTPATPVND
ncbi:hypothetical protein F4821DRAFT_251111 [Hypoxylon rubiginosum]|uniref:Uncharacterized protein n=1 Tax=Hypoxylon rubiginosum TaxID=110542 RepID=A0ACC0CJN6_9PEZI|nr:hypothetical protein F4821DRAFT_251111 [Hypoxylon rubiginosum]